MHMLAVKRMQADMSLPFKPRKCILTKYSILTAVMSHPLPVLYAPFQPLITKQVSAICMCHILIIFITSIALTAS